MTNTPSPQAVSQEPTEAMIEAACSRFVDQCESIWSYGVWPDGPEDTGEREGVGYVRLVPEAEHYEIRAAMRFALTDALAASPALVATSVGEAKCENCNGEGSVEYEGGDGEGWPSKPERDTCLKCRGTGRAAPPAPAGGGLDREALIALIMEETTDDLIADGWRKLGKPNVLVQGCRYLRRTEPTNPTEGYENAEASAKQFAGFIADRLLKALATKAPDIPASGGE